MIRWLLRVSFSITVLAALVAFLLNPLGSLTRLVTFVALALFVGVVLELLYDYFVKRNKPTIPPSQVAEMERLYFRSVREMLNSTVNTQQVINDLQRILTIDAHYKNARHYLQRALILHAEMSGKEVPTSLVKDPNSPEFRRLNDLLIDPDPAVRKSIIMEFIQYGSAAIDPLIALLMDEDNDVRIHAATALGWVGGEEAVDPLLVALGDENRYVRRYAARALCWVVNATAVPTITKALNDDDSYVRQYAARALGWRGDKANIRPLVERLRLENDHEVREAIFTALEDMGEKNIKDLRSDPPPAALE